MKNANYGTKVYRTLAASFFMFGFVTTAVAAASSRVVSTVMPNAKPESVTIAPNGAVIMSSMAAPIVFRAGPDAAKADVFIDMRPDQAALALGVLADADTNTLWVCEILKADLSRQLPTGQSVLRSFDLQNGKPTGRYPLPGTNNWCNDITLAPDHSIYVTDTFGSRILRLRPGAKTLETVLQDPTLYGVDGITYLRGVLYINNFWSGNIYRVSLDVSGKARDLIQIALSRVIKRPDGMRAANGRLFVAENAGHRVVAITISGDRGTVTTIKDGLVQPTGVAPFGDTLWVSDLGASKAYAMQMSN